MKSRKLMHLRASGLGTQPSLHKVSDKLKRLRWITQTVLYFDKKLTSMVLLFQSSVCYLRSVEMNWWFREASIDHQFQNIDLLCKANCLGSIVPRVFNKLWSENDQCWRNLKTTENLRVRETPNHLKTQRLFVPIAVYL